MMNTLVSGWQELTRHSKLWLVVFMAFIVPAVFVFFVYKIDDSARANLMTSLFVKVSTIHDVLELVADSDSLIDPVLTKLKLGHPELVKVQIVEDINGDIIVRHDLNQELVSTEVAVVAPYRTALIRPGETFIYEYERDDRYIKQAFRSINVNERSLYLFTEHDFTKDHQIFQKRVYSMYGMVVLFILFTIALAYWVATQIHYKALYVQLNESLAERDLFTSSLVHEIRAPMTVIKGYASMLEESKQLSQLESGYAQKIRQGTERLIVLVNDYLEAARIKSGQLPLKSETFSLDQLVEKIVHESKPLAETKGLALAVSLPRDEQQVTTDSKRVEQIVTNILSNAIKYTAKGSITVSVEHQYRTSKVTIADTGNGISAEDQKSLFLPFKRFGDEAKKEKITGTGLGMWITKLLAEQLNGRISVESIKGVGTHVSFTLPHTVK